MALSDPAAECRQAIDDALGNVRAAILMLDDESTPALGWEDRDELVDLPRESVRELRKL